jgi:sodium transport system permease protein
MNPSDQPQSSFDAEAKSGSPASTDPLLSTDSPAESHSGSSGRSPFSWAQQLEFTRKELRETLRDRRTIVTLLAMPLLLYPLLGLGFRFLSFQQLSKERPRYVLAFESELDAAWVVEGLEQLRSGRVSDPSKLPANPPTSPDPLAPGKVEPHIDFAVSQDGTPLDLEELVAEGAVDVGIRLKFLSQLNGRLDLQGPVELELIENAGSLASRGAADYVEEQFESIGLARVTALAARDDQSFQFPVQQKRTSIGMPETGAVVLGLLPLILLLMTVTGGVYPAIDLTAGERERNTLETLISLPVPKFRLLLAKYVAVVTVTMLTGLMNLLAMSVTLYVLQLDVLLVGSGGFTFALALKLFLALFAFALFYSAVLLMLTSSARSFKEAQAYLIPLLLLSIGPGLVILVPGWNLDSITAVTPLINILLLSRDLLEGTARLLPALVAIISTVLYGLAALALAAQVFAADAVAVGSRGRWSEFLKPPADSRSVPTTAMAFVALAILFPAYFVASGILARISEISPSYRLFVSGAMTVLLFMGIPILLLRWSRVSMISGLSLRWPSLQTVAGGLLLGLVTWPLVFELIVAAQAIGFRGPDLSQFEQVEELLAGWKQVPLILILITLGLIPGVCEEAFFRGFLYNGIREHFSVRSTILITAIAFGLFHVVLAGGAAPERLLPSTLMGLLLAWLRWKSGSLIPGIILHAVHNSTLLTIAQNRDELAGWGVMNVARQTHLPLAWVVIAGIGFILGLGIVYFSKHSASEADSPARNANPE